MPWLSSLVAVVLMGVKSKDCAEESVTAGCDVNREALSSMQKLSYPIQAAHLPLVHLEAAQELTSLSVA